MAALLVLAALGLLSRLRLGAEGAYTPEGWTLRVRVGPVHLRIFPRKRPKQSKKAPDSPQKSSPLEASGTTARLERLEQLWELLPLFLRAAGRLKRAVRVDRLHLDVTAGGEDPGDTALFYGRLNAFLSMAVPLLEHHFEVKDRRIRTAVDFQAETTRISFRAAVSLTLGQILALGMWFLIALARRPRRGGASAPSKQKEAVTNGK